MGKTETCLRMCMEQDRVEVHKQAPTQNILQLYFEDTRRITDPNINQSVEEERSWSSEITHWAKVEIVSIFLFSVMTVPTNLFQINFWTQFKNTANILQGGCLFQESSQNLSVRLPDSITIQMVMQHSQMGMQHIPRRST